MNAIFLIWGLVIKYVALGYGAFWGVWNLITVMFMYILHTIFCCTYLHTIYGV